MTTPNRLHAGLQAIVSPLVDRDPTAAAPETEVRGRSIGDFIREVRRLSDAQVDSIVMHQRAHGMRFGEAAIALDMASKDDVLWALSQQFHYPYPPAEGQGFHEDLVVAVDPFGEQAETFRAMRSQLMTEVLATAQRPVALAVLSPGVGDGKSFFAANLAIAFSQLGGKTLLIDADMRTPHQHELFGLAADKGLSGMLCGRAESDVIHRVRDLPSLHVLPVGALPPNPLELIQRPAFGMLLRELLGKFDHVLVDTPAAAHGADARMLALACGAAVVIGRRHVTAVKPLQALVQALSRTPTRLAGVLINEH